MIIVFHSQNDGSTLLHNLFNQMDIDLNGFLSMTEAEAVLKAMDANGRDSRLTFFLRYILQECKYRQRAKIFISNRLQTSSELPIEYIIDFIA